MPIDPTCGLFVADSEGALRAEVRGHAYHFCSPRCLRAFTAPQRELAWAQRSAALALAGGAVLFALPAFHVMAEPGLGWALLGLGTAVQAIAGWPFYSGVWQAIRNRAANLDILVALGTSLAWLFGAAQVLSGAPGPRAYYFDVGSLVLGFLLIARIAEQRMRRDTGEQVQKLMELQPRTALLLREGKAAEVPVEELDVGDIVLVRAGQSVSVDGVVQEGRTAVDEAMITGESMPVDKALGDTVIGGSVNLDSDIQVKVARVGTETTLTQILALIEKAGTHGRRGLGEAVSAWFLPLVVGASLVAFAGWLAIAGAPLPAAFSVLLAVLLIASPSSLSLAAAPVLRAGVSRGARQGIVIKGGEGLERVEAIDLVVFDKTGTLTMGQPALTDCLPFEGSEKDLLLLAASAEQASAHPLAKMLVRTAKGRKLKLSEPEHFFSMAGAGVEATVQGARVLVGNVALFTDRRYEVRPHMERIHALQDQGKTVVLVARDDDLAGILAFADPLKPEASEAVQRLQGMGIEVALVTGDNVRTAKAVAQQLGIKKSFAEISPHGKAGLVKALQEGDKVVAMVGDGVNDAPALAAADVGIAIGTGADVAVEAGDFVLLKSDPRDVGEAIALGRATLAIVRKNMRWALGYNAVLIPLAALGVLPPLLAGLAMAVSSLPVAANSLRVAKRWEAGAPPASEKREVEVPMALVAKR